MIFTIFTRDMFVDRRDYIGDGYQTLIIWEHEFIDIGKLGQIVEEQFNGKNYI